MAKIKVTRGGCGIQYTDANGNARHALKTPENGPFECDDAQAAHFVSLGMAEYVGAAIQETEKARGHLSAEDLETWDYNDLKKLAADMGVEPKGKKKADYITAIVAVEVEIGEGDTEAEGDGDEPPVLNAADPE